MFLRRLFLTAASGAALVSSLPVLAQQQIGVTAAVNPAAEGRPPIAQPRELRVGVNVVANERIVTTDKGQAQMLFLDESAFSIGPDSDVVLDEFVYDPNAGTGKIALSATKGVFRVVGGKISKNTPVELKTPTATIGIRGGIALVNVAPNGATRATFVFGSQMTVTTASGSQSVTRPGFSVSATTANALPSAPVQATTQELTSAVSSLEGAAPPAGPTNAGGGQTPNDNQVAQTQLSQQNSGNAPQNVAPPGGPGPGPQPAPSGQPSQASQTTTQAQQNQTQDSSVLPLGPSFSGTYSGLLRIAPYYNASSFVNTTGVVSANADNIVGFSSGTFSNGFLRANFTFDGDSFTNFPIAFFPKTGLLTGTFDDFGVESDLDASVTAFLDPLGKFFFAELKYSSDPLDRDLIFGGKPISPSFAMSSSGFAVRTFDLRADFLNNNNSAIPFLSNFAGGNISSPTISPLYRAIRPSTATDAISPFLQVSLAITGQGSAQQSVLSGATGTTLFNDDGQLSLAGGQRGSARMSATGVTIRTSTGVSSVPDGIGASLYGDGQTVEYFVLNQDSYNPGQNFITPNLAFQASHDNLMGSGYAFDHIASRSTTPSGVGTTRTTRTLNGYIGGVFERNTSGFPGQLLQNKNGLPTDLSITTDTATNRVGANFMTTSVFGTAVNYNLTFGNATGQNSGRGAFVDDNIFAARENVSAIQQVDGMTATSARLLMVNADVAPETGFLPSGVSFCSCQFSEWGYWIADIQVGATRDRVHLGTWVAGVLPSLPDIPVTGTATYNGHINGSVINGTAKYQAVGTFQNTWNFSTASGSVAITNFDGTNYSGSASAMNGRDFSGSFSATNRNGMLKGSFFSGGGDPVKEQGGQFHIMESSGTTYRASGTFQATK